MAKFTLLLLGLTLFASSTFASRKSEVADFGAHFENEKITGDDKGLFVFQVTEKEEGGKLIPTVHFHGNNCGKLPIGEGYNHVLYVVIAEADKPVRREIFYYGNKNANDYADDLDKMLDKRQKGDESELEELAHMNLQEPLREYGIRTYFAKFHKAGVAPASISSDVSCLYLVKGTEGKMEIHEVQAILASVNEGDVYCIHIDEATKYCFGESGAELTAAQAFFKAEHNNKAFLGHFGKAEDTKVGAAHEISDEEYSAKFLESLEIFHLDIDDTDFASEEDVSKDAAEWAKIKYEEKREFLVILHKQGQFGLIHTPKDMSNEQIKRTVETTVAFLAFKKIVAEVPVHMTEAGKEDAYLKEMKALSQKLATVVEPNVA